MDSSPIPKINATFEVVCDGITGSTNATVKRVEMNDDGSYTVVIDHWPEPEQVKPSQLTRGSLAREQYMYRLMLDQFKHLGVSDGEPGWIEHSDQDGTLRKDRLSFEGEMIFGFDAITERIAMLEHQLAAQPTVWYDKSAGGFYLSEDSIPKYCKDTHDIVALKEVIK